MSITEEAAAEHTSMMGATGDPTSVRQTLEMQRRLLAKTKTDKTNALLKKSKLVKYLVHTH